MATYQLPDHERLPVHITASAVVIEQTHILLVHHKRIGAWLPPGGHMDGDEMPHETAIRETFEETGVQIEILSEQLPQTHDPEAFLLHSPLCVHAVKAHEKGNAVFHIDLAFLCRPLNKTDKLPDILSTPEVHEARWIKLAEMDKVPLAKNVPEIVELAIKKLQLQSR